MHGAARAAQASGQFYGPGMKQELVRFGVAMEAELLGELDLLAGTRGCTRSELLRDLARTELARAARQQRVPAVAAVTLVYNHHVRHLSERLTEIQHELGDQVRSSMHVHLDIENCLEVIVLRGRSDQLRDAAEKMLATRGVSHGGWELVTEKALKAMRGTKGGEAKKKKGKGKGKGKSAHAHVHAHEHEHEHD
jgi:CopG family nickel-responsive transcriptional regulator